MKMTEDKIAQARMTIGDRVKVVSGAYLGLIGEVKEITEIEVAVYLHSQGIVENMLKDTLRTEFEIADQVRNIRWTKSRFSGLGHWNLDGQSTCLEHRGWYRGR